MQIRHNIVVERKPFFRRGGCVLKAAHHLEGSENIKVPGMNDGGSIGSAGWRVCAVACALLWPRARDAGAILAAQDDPAALSDVQLNAALRNNQAVIEQNIETALAAEDADLANSFVDLAREKNIAVNDELSRRVAAVIVEENSSSHFAKRFATGRHRNADDVGEPAGTVAGDLFVFMTSGRGAWMRIWRWRRYRSAGAVSPLWGLVVTAASPVGASRRRHPGRMPGGPASEGLTRWAGCSAPDGRRADAATCGRPPGDAAGDHVSDKSGVSRREGYGWSHAASDALARRRDRAAQETLKIAEGPKDVARAARLAESKGSQTRAILKVLGRGALLLAAGAFDLTLWVFSALLALFCLLSSIKATTERLTMSWLLRKKARRLRKQMAAAALPSEPSLAGAVAHG
jgi:hypothetical protein